MPLISKFLCCLPLRVGTLVVAFCHFVYGTICLVWFLAEQKPHQDSKFVRICLTLWPGILTSMTILCIPGFFGAVSKSSKRVSIFSAALSAFSAIKVGIAVTDAVIFLQESKADIYRNCLGPRTDEGTKATCRNAVDHLKAYFFGMFVLPMLFLAYGCFVVRGYAAELRSAGVDRSASEDEYSMRYRYDPVGGGERISPSVPFHRNGYQA